MTPVRRARPLGRTERGMSFDLGPERTCRISVLGPSLVRVLHLREGRPVLPRTWTVIEPGAADGPWEGRDRTDERGWTVPPLTIEEDDGVVRLRTEALAIEVALDPFALTWRLPDGRAFAADRKHGHEFSRHRNDVAHHMLRHERDRYYGLGDKTGKLDLHGRRVRAMGLDSLGYDAERGDPLYKHWPFLLTQDGATGVSYGLYYDNGAVAAFDLGCAHDNYFGPFRSYEARDGDLDFYLWLGPRLSDVTPGFLELTGRTAMPPRWTLGFAQTAMAIADLPNAQAEMERFIDRAGQEAVPISAFHFGSGYTSIGPKRYVFNWNRDKFPDAAGLIRRFNQAGMRVVANLKPCLLDDHPRYREITGCAVHDANGPVLTQFWDGEGAHLDFTDPAAVRWWQDGLSEAILGVGIDAGWNDNNEYPLWDEDARCAGFGEPVRLELVRAVQALLMTRATRERQGADSFTVTRAGCPGIQRYAQTWSGDNTTGWAALKWGLRTGLQMSLSGMYNTGHDIGGFAGPVPEPELLVRWTQAGVVHPRFIMNSWKPGGVSTTPWLHKEAIAPIRAAILLRYRLIPYLYSLMAAASRRHDPVIAPTFWHFEDDPRCFADGDELMLGPVLLAAPVVEPGARERRVYLPAGPESWFEFDTGVAHPAGAEAVVAAPLDRLPLFAKAGAIVPTTARDGTHDEPSRHLRLFPGLGSGVSAFVLAEEGGEVVLSMGWTPSRVTLRGAAGMTASLPDGDARTLEIVAG